MFYFEKRIKKVRSKFKGESKKEKVLSIVFVNLFLTGFCLFLIKTILFHL